MLNRDNAERIRHGLGGHALTLRALQMVQLPRALSF